MQTMQHDHHARDDEWFGHTSFAAQVLLDVLKERGLPLPILKPRDLKPESV
jgi:hypothetical protein